MRILLQRTLNPKPRRKIRDIANKHTVEFEGLGLGQLAQDPKENSYYERMRA